MWEQLKKYSALVIIAALLAVAAFSYFKYQAYQQELADLRNQVAAKDKTVEELKGTYGKLATENERLKASSQDLQRLFDKTKQDLIAETQATITWKNAYVIALKHTPGQPVPPGPGPTPPQPTQKCTEAPLLYSAVEDLGLLKLTIGTVTRDPDYTQSLKVEAGSKPLKLTLDLTRDGKKQWRNHVTSSDDRIAVEIGVASVNIAPLEQHWYERLKVVGDLGAGTSGLLGGVGATYEFGKWEAGPKVWAYPGGQAAGATFTYAPFKSN